VIGLDPKTARAIEPLLGRVLILDATAASSRLLTELLQAIGRGQIRTAAATDQALRLAETFDPQLIFTEFLADGVDGIQFTTRLRRSAMSCRRAPVIMVTAQATPASILAARDAGVHEFLRKPFTNKDLVRRLEAVAVKPREWIEAVGYVGPDRRRFNSAEYRGARRRRIDEGGDPNEGRIVQALKIVSSALGAIERDRPQAFRALNAQAAAIQNAGAILRRPQVIQAAHGLQRRLAEIRHPSQLTREAIEVEALALLAFLPEQAPQSARPAA
jgi:CheY-like chemotaxis protein